MTPAVVCTFVRDPKGFIFALTLRHESRHIKARRTRVGILVDITTIHKQDYRF